MSAEKSNVTENLRMRAEDLLTQSRENFLSSDIEDINKLHHELAVHQAELELQNEELRHTQLSLQKVRDRYVELYEHAPVGYVLLDAAGIIRHTNATWRAMLGRPDDDFCGTPFAETLVEGDDRIFLSRFRSLLHNPADKQVELQIKRHNTKPFHAHITAKRSIGEGTENDTNELMIIVSDITERKRMELQLVRDNILLKTQQEASPDGILIVDENDNIISFNQRFCNIWEIPDHIMAEQSSEKAMQYVLPRLINPDEFVKRIRDLYKNKKASSFEEIALTNGKILARHSSPMFGSDTQYYGRVWFYRDITARKVAEEETKRFKTISDNAVYGKAIADLDGNLIYINRFFAEIHGYSPAELIGKNLSIFHTASQLENVDKTNRTLLQDGYFSPCEVWHVHRNGTEFPMLMSGVLLKDDHGNPQYLAASAVDITEGKQAQLDLEKKNEEMAQLVYSVSHDLKSPLITVKTFTGMLRRNLQGGDQQQITKDLSYIDKAADKMQQLLDALLQFSRIGRIDTRAQTLPANQLVQNCLAALAGILRQHQVQVSTSELPYQLHGSHMYFGQIWQNIIENAVKYRGDQPQPQIEIGATQQGPEVVFYVRDNGMGIAPEHWERIFNLFSQLQPGSDGSGLGLALVKKIVTMYQGRIWVESAGEGAGSCFMFTLPGALVKDGSPP